MTNLLIKAQDAIREAQVQQTRYANEKRREESFEIDEMVLLSSRHITLRQLSNQPSKKLQNKFLGPFKIIAKISAVAYKLELPSTMKIHPVFHVSLLKRYTPNNDDLFPDRQVIPPTPILVNDTEEFEVEDIISDRKHGRNRIQQYLVKWKGYPASENSWVNANDLHAPEILTRYKSGSQTHK